MSARGLLWLFGRVVRGIKVIRAIRALIRVSRFIIRIIRANEVVSRVIRAALRVQQVEFFGLH